LHVTVPAENGEYWRLLVPGRYNVTAVTPGYQPQSKEVSVADSGHNEAQRLDFSLSPLAEDSAVDTQVGIDDGNEIHNDKIIDSIPNQLNSGEPQLLLLTNNTLLLER